MRYLFTLLSFIGFGTNGFCQSVMVDSVLYSPAASVKDGIFLSYNDFRKNASISKVDIISSQDKNQLEFFTKVMAQEIITYSLGETTYTTASKSVWGYFQNNTLYINYKNDFYRVPVFGSISYLVANVRVPTVGFYDARFGYNGASGTAIEVREFLMNFYDGNMVEFTGDKAEELLSRDVELYSEFKKLSRKKQRTLIYQYIRKYNERNSIYFLK